MNDTKKSNSNDAKKNAASMILAEIGMFNEAQIIFEKAEEEITTKIKDFFVHWAEVEGWIHGNDEWIYPPEWEGKNEEDGRYARFMLNYSISDNSSHIATWCGFSDTNSSYGIEFSNGDFFGGNKKWNALYKLIPQEIKLNVSQKSGYSDLGRGRYFLPIRLDAKELASAYENDDYEDAFRPIAQALENLKDSISCFTDLLICAEKLAGT